MDDDYDTMSQTELLARVRDWRQLANDRSTEIARLHDQREYIDAALRDVVTERDRLRAEVTTLGIQSISTEGQWHDLVAERDRLQTVVGAVREAFVRHDDDHWCIAHHALVSLAQALDQLDEPRAEEDA
jgi:hypothetical protein